MSKHIPPREHPLTAPPHSGSSPVTSPEAPAGSSSPGRAVPGADTASAAGASGAAQIPQDQVAARAYELWLEQGRPDGKHLDHWFEAERQLHEQQSAPQAATAPLNPTR